MSNKNYLLISFLIFSLIAVSGSNCSNQLPPDGTGGGAHPPSEINLRQRLSSVSSPDEVKNILNSGNYLAEFQDIIRNEPNQFVEMMNEAEDKGVNIFELNLVRGHENIKNIICADSNMGEASYRWMQVGVDGKIFKRAIVEGDRCPRVKLKNGNCPRMQIRAAKDDLFPVTSCEIETKISVRNRRTDPIAVIGDTGCDNKAGQNCSNDWPFEQIAESVASKTPKLIIHTGDYVYRKIEGKRDSWKVWEADFFKPAKRMFAQAAFVFVRGNHEQSKESPKGWYRFLAPGPYTGKECEHKSNTIDEPYAIHWGDAKLLMLDSSSASDTKKDHSMIDNLVDDLRILNKKAVADNWKDVWLLTHRPMWSCAPLAWHGSWTIRPAGCDAPPDASIRAVWNTWKNETSDSRITKVLSGHIHLFNVASFQDQGPSQMIVGNSGTALSGTTYFDINDGSRTLQNKGYYGHHGYVLMRPLSTNEPGIFQWDVNVLDKKGNPVMKGHYSRYPIKFKLSKSSVSE